MGKKREMVLILCLPSLIFAYFIGVSWGNFGLAKNKDLSIILKFCYFEFQIPN